MSFLPIVERELRVAARKRRTYWSRVTAAAAALFIAAALFSLAELERGVLGRQLGSVLFGIFKGLSFAYACSAGVFLTSDCLSEEKREGTLGLLFLTDLRGYDIVLGKLLATSLWAAYALVAAFPIIGLSFLLGGVTAGEFWRLVLLLCNTLFFSLTIGALVSSISLDAHRAMTGAMALLVACLALLPGLDWWVAGWKAANFIPRLSLFSPTFAFTQTGSIRLADFWTCMGVIHGLAWLSLGLASAWAPRSWQEKSLRPGRAAPDARPSFSRRQPRVPRSRLLDQNPLRWLALRHRRTSRGVRIMIASGAGLYILLLVSSSNFQGAFNAGMALLALLAFAFVVWVASQASRFFLEARQNGMLELVLVTPVRVAQVVEGHWWALKRAFLVPAVVLAGLQVTNQALQIAMMIESLTRAAPPGGAISYGFIPERVLSGALGLVGFGTGLFAIASFGMWMGLTSRRTNVAVIKTLVFVQVFPWLALSFLRVLLTVALFSSQAFRGAGFPTWAPALATGILGIGLDLFFILLARRKVLSGFRALISQPTEPVVPSSPPLLPASVGVPATPSVAP